MIIYHQIHVYMYTYSILNNLPCVILPRLWLPIAATSNRMDWTPVISRWVTTSLLLLVGNNTYFTTLVSTIEGNYDSIEDEEPDVSCIE